MSKRDKTRQPDLIEEIPFKSIMDEPRTKWPDRWDHSIVKAAVRIGDKVYTGWRHDRIIRHVCGEGLSNYIDQDSQGFVDNFGNYFDRFTSAKIAVGNRQIPLIRHHTLCSEELWDVRGRPLNNPGEPYNPVGDRR